MPGSKTKYDPKHHLKLLKYMAMSGLTDAQMAKELGIVRATLSNWKVNFPEVKEALEDWKAVADNKVERSLYERATGYSYKDKHYPADPTSMIFWLKNRKSEEWRDKRDIGSDPNEPMTIKIIHD